MRNKFFFLAIAYFGLIASALGQEGGDEKAPKKVKILPVPTFGYSPETKTYVGAVALFNLDFYQDSVTRASNAKVEFTYTWNKQIVLEAGWNYFFKDEKWFTEGRLHFSDYPDRYYGIGAQTPDSLETWFNSKRIITEVSILKAIRPKMFIGPAVKFASYYHVNYTSDYLFPELMNRKNGAVGLVYLFDNRNNLLNATQGKYVKIYAGYSFNGSVNNPLLNVDLRAFKTFKEKYTIATRWYSSFNFGTPTFYNYSVLGGDAFVRGYLYGRFRDNTLSTVQIESRNHLFWRIGMTVFGGYSLLSNQQDHFNSSNFKYNYGAGLRFLMDKEDQINLRLDFAIGENGQTGFYVAFGESF